MNLITQLKPYESVEFPWGVGVRHCNGKWTTVFIKPLAQEIDVSQLNVILHDNGIEFIDH